MLNPRLKTRSDYHNLNAHTASVTRLPLWLKPSFFIMIGFMMGIVYHKFMTRTASITLASVDTQAQQVQVDAKPHYKNARISAKA